MNGYEEYVTYAQAKALKELGFNWPCRHYATKRDTPEGHYWNCTPASLICNSMMLDCEVAIPTQTMACRWLREEKDIEVYAIRHEVYGAQVGFLYKVNYHSDNLAMSKGLPTYESALSAGIDRALELLKGGEKCGCR